MMSLSWNCRHLIFLIILKLGKNASLWFGKCSKTVMLKWSILILVDAVSLTKEYLS